MAHVDVKVTYLTSFKIPIPTKESARCILCTNIGVAVVTILCVEGFLIFLFLIHICVRMRAYQICQLSPKPRPRIARDMDKAMQDRMGKTEDPYRPGSEMMDRALPEERPPSPFSYTSPPKITAEVPLAAEYLPPKPAIELANIQSVKDQEDSNEFGEKHNKHSALNEAYRQKTRPSIFQNKSYVPRAVNNRLATGATNIYNYTKYDMELLPPDLRSEKQMKVSPMFSRPDKSILYSDSSKYLPDIGEPASAMDF